MNARLDIGVIGLGVMGQRMLERLAAHPRLRASWVWDADAAAVQRTLQVQPQLRAAPDAASLIASPGLHSLYIATPPAAHLALSHAAFDAGLAVLCEKPLTVDFDAARCAIERIAHERQRAAVNFSLASSPGLAAVQQAFAPGAAGAQGVLGALQSVHIELAFAAWPRPWQAAAGDWLSQRVEGGFVREVLSHFVFVLQRVLGPAEVVESHVDYPMDGRSAETAVRARLRAGGIEVHVDGRVDATLASADHNRMCWRGTRGELELRDWFGVLRRGPGADDVSAGDPMSLRARGQAEQLDQWVRLIEGDAHTLPGFDEALAVQQTIEEVLARGCATNVKSAIAESDHR